MKTNNMINRLHLQLLKLSWESGNVNNIENAVYIAAKDSDALKSIIEKVAIRLSNDKLDMILAKKRKELRSKKAP